MEVDATPPPRRLRLRFPIICLVLFWATTIAALFIDKLYFYGFLLQMGSTALFLLFFLGWWFFNRGLKFGQKLLGFAIIIAGGAVAATFVHKSLGVFPLFHFGLPLAAAVAIFVIHRAYKANQRLIGLPFVTAIAAAWTLFLVVRVEGLDSSLRGDYHWRWTPSNEERFLATTPLANPSLRTAPATNEATMPNEWLEFRGPHRDGVVLGSTISTNWNSNPPKLLWKRPVGPSWSSITAVGSRLFSQEQRGPSEVVVCYDAGSGQELWAIEEATRFEDPLSGIGPRGTPTYDKGRLYTLGATGALICSDAITGKFIWKRDITRDANAPKPAWGFSSSPLLADGKVIVYAGGEKGLLAYKMESGELAWNCPAGKTSYSSPQLNTIDGVSQCLLVFDRGVMGVEIATGKKLWEAGQVFEGAPRSNQPHQISPNDFIVGAVNGQNSSSLKISKSSDAWTVSTNWISKDFKPEFPDFVVFNNHIFGFDINLFTCVNAADGKRVWKEGRYGRGQVLLLRDQNLLLVATESGELVLLAVDPTAHRELGRFQALEGKNWNGPIVRGDKIFHRNAQEMACYLAAEPVAKKIATE
jgi:outer membrane protein assembly factor BamB